MKRYELVAKHTPYRGVHIGIIVVEDGATWRTLTNDIGFAWGYDGEGPSEAARAILTDLLGSHPEYPIVRDFVDSLLADEHRSRWSLTEAEIRAWLVARPPKPGLDVGAVR